jgi:hypothetical protein
MSGVPASISIVASVSRASGAELAQPHGDRRADRHRDRHRDQRAQRGPDHRIEEPAGLALIEARGRRGEQQVQAHVAQSLHEQVQDDPGGERAEQESQRPRDREPDPVGQAPRCTHATTP